MFYQNHQAASPDLRVLATLKRLQPGAEELRGKVCRIVIFLLFEHLIMHWPFFDEACSSLRRWGTLFWSLV